MRIERILSRKKILFLLPVLALFAIAFASATITCNTTSINLTSANPLQKISCNNDGNLTYLSSNNGYVGIYPGQIGGNTTGVIITISLTSNAPQNGMDAINFQDGSPSIPVQISQQQSQGSGICNLITLQQPGALTITQGDNGSKGTIEVVSPNCNNLQFSAQANPQTFIYPVNMITNQQGNDFTFNIGYNAPTTSQPTTNYIFTVSAKNPANLSNTATINIPVLITVQQSNTPAGNVSINNLPQCSLDKTSYPVNSSGTLSCTTNPNIQIFPNLDPNYIIGTGATTTNGVFQYTFQTQKLGQTVFDVKFLYSGVPFGQDFMQKVNIVPSNVANGTTFNVIFTPSLDSLQSTPGPYNITVQSVDPSNNLISDVTYYLNAQQVNNTFTLQSGVNYSFRASTPGFSDYTGTLYLNPQPIAITTSPNPLIAGSQINITLNPSNATLLIDGVSPNINLTNGSYILTMTSGIHTLEASADGYITTDENISVLQAISANLTTIWQKNVQQVLVLNRDANWTVLYAQDSSSQYNPVSSGTGSRIVYTPQNVGLYQVQANGLDVGDYQIAQSGLIAFLKNNWIWMSIVAVILAVIIFISVRRGSSYTPPIGGGTELFQPM